VDSGQNELERYVLSHVSRHRELKTLFDECKYFPDHPVRRKTTNYRLLPDADVKRARRKLIGFALAVLLGVAAFEDFYRA